MEILKVKPTDFDKIKRFTTSAHTKGFLAALEAIDGVLSELSNKYNPNKFEIDLGDLRYEIGFIVLTQTAGSGCGLSLILYAEYRINGVWRALPSNKYTPQAVKELVFLSRLVK